MDYKPSDINTWYKTPLGIKLLSSELTVLDSVLPQTFGYYSAQIGGPPINDKILAKSHIRNHIVINPDTDHLPENRAAIRCKIDNLPFMPESIDAFMLFHVLEFVKNPQQLLQEIYDSLITGGHLIIFSFNPYSLWGITKLWRDTKEKLIWNRDWLPPQKLHHLLLKMGFSVGDYQTFYFLPPSDKDNSRKMLFLEGMGQIFWPYCGASYMYVAQKKYTVLTPTDKLISFVKKEAVQIKGLLKSSSRTSQCNPKQQL